MVFVTTVVFVCGVGIGLLIGYLQGYKAGSESKRQTLIKGMDALLENDEIKIYVKKGSTFLTDGPR